MVFDVAIVGGSYAGLSAALQLARARRSVAVFDTGQRRNRFAASSHGFLAQDGRAPGDIVAEARAQLLGYASVTWFDRAVLGPVHTTSRDRVDDQKGCRQGANRSRVGHPARICNAACGPSGHQPFGTARRSGPLVVAALARTSVRASAAPRLAPFGGPSRPCWSCEQALAIDGQADAFVLRTAAGPQHARRLVLATGVADALPAVPGLAERWGRSVFHCPYCHGHELQQGRIGVIATGPMSLHQAQLLPEWGRVTLFLNGALALDATQASELAARGVQVEATPVAAITHDARVVLADGTAQDFAGLFTAPTTRPASPLAAQLGCEHEAGPMGPFVKTNEMKQTSMPGVFACGDLARAAGNVALAVGDGAQAGVATHRSLVFGL